MLHARFSMGVLFLCLIAAVVFTGCYQAEEKAKKETTVLMDNTAQDIENVTADVKEDTEAAEQDVQRDVKAVEKDAELTEADAEAGNRALPGDIVNGSLVTEDNLRRILLEMPFEEVTGILGAPNRREDKSDAGGKDAGRFDAFWEGTGPGTHSVSIQFDAFLVQSIKVDGKEWPLSMDR